MLGFLTCLSHGPHSLQIDVLFIIICIHFWQTDWENFSLHDCGRSRQVLLYSVIYCILKWNWRGFASEWGRCRHINAIFQQSADITETETCIPWNRYIYNIYINKERRRKDCNKLIPLEAYLHAYRWTLRRSAAKLKWLAAGQRGVPPSYVDNTPPIAPQGRLIIVMSWQYLKRMNW